MPTHRSHEFDYVQPDRHDELTEGVPAALVHDGARAERRPDGTVSKGAQEFPAAGGRARKGRTKLSHEITGAKLSPQSVKRARFLRRAMSAEIASTVGGGRCGVIASLLIKFAAQKTAAAEEAFERGDYEAHRRLSESARMDSLYAREHAAKEAKARGADDATDAPWILASGKGGT